jgi:hypothetical protein
MLFFAASSAFTLSIAVNCDQGQSLNRTLSMMNKDVPTTVLVKGTCTEYVVLNGFQGLTLKGLQGASLSQPATDPKGGLDIFVLVIEASRSITIDGLAVHSRSSALSSIGIGRGSSDIRLRNLAVDGNSTFEILVFDHSEASLAKVTARDPGYAAVFVGDMSHAHIEDCLFEHSTGDYWHAGIQVGQGGVVMHGTTIRNMQVGLFVDGGGNLQINEDTSYYPAGGAKDVIIENPARTNFWGAYVVNGGSLSVGNANLRITNAGQPWGGNTGGVFVSNGGALNASANLGGNLIISGSQGQGVLVDTNSHATFAGSSITGSGHGGLVVTNLSTASVAGADPMTTVSGSGVDLFCDSRSLITGGANIASPTSVQCNNLLTDVFEAIP